MIWFRLHQGRQNTENAEGGDEYVHVGNLYRRLRGGLMGRGCGIGTPDASTWESETPENTLPLPEEPIQLSYELFTGFEPEWKLVKINPVPGSKYNP
jgi:hypothetical protein